MVQRRKRAKKEIGKTQISISLPESLVGKIDRLADTENRNRSNFIATQLERLADEADMLEANEPKATYSAKKRK